MAVEGEARIEAKTWTKRNERRSIKIVQYVAHKNIYTDMVFEKKKKTAENTREVFHAATKWYYAPSPSLPPHPFPSNLPWSAVRTSRTIVCILFMMTQRARGSLRRRFTTPQNLFRKSLKKVI